MNPVEFTTAIVAVANAIACNLSDDDLDLTAAVFSQLGSTLSFIALQRNLADKAKEKAAGSSDTDDFAPVDMTNPLLPLL